MFGWKIFASFVFFTLMIRLNGEEPLTLPDSTGTSVSIYGDKLDKDDTAAILKAIGALRSRVTSVLNERDIVKVLNTNEVRADVLSKVASYLGASAGEKIGLDAYAEAVVLPETQAAPYYGMKRIFVYDNSAALANARKGQVPKYLAYDKAKDFLNFSWSSGEDNKDNPDMPLVFIVKRSHLISFESQVKIGSTKYAEVLEGLIKEEYNVRTFRFIQHVVRRWLEKDFHSLPKWYHEGLINAICALVAKDLIGLNNTIKGFNGIYGRVPCSRDFVLEDIFRWDEASDKNNRVLLVRTSIETVMDVIERGKAGSCGMIMKNLREENSASEITSEMLFERFATVGGVDLKKKLIESLPKKTKGS